MTTHLVRSCAPSSAGVEIRRFSVFIISCYFLQFVANLLQRHGGQSPAVATSGWSSNTGRAIREKRTIAEARLYGNSSTQGAIGTSSSSNMMQPFFSNLLCACGRCVVSWGASCAPSNAGVEIRPFSVSIISPVLSCSFCNWLQTSWRQSPAVASDWNKKKEQLHAICVMLLAVTETHTLPAFCAGNLARHPRQQRHRAGSPVLQAGAL